MITMKSRSRPGNGRQTLVASFVIAGQSNGFDPADCKEAAWLAAQVTARKW